MKDIVNYWEDELRKITDFTNVTSKEDLILKSQNKTYYYNVYGRKLLEDKSEESKYNLVLTNKTQIKASDLEKEIIIDLPTVDIINQMIEVFRLTEQNGLEHGFVVYEDNTPSKIIEGTETEIPKEKWYELIRDRNYEFYYTIHSHPKKENEDTTEPSVDKDLKSDFGSSGIGIILGYGAYKKVDLSSGATYGETKELRRSIVFYTKKGKIKISSEDVEFDNYKTNKKFAAITYINRL
ncbi:MAG: hypothetical protein PHO12_09550 [Bacteroidales bacterium]|nr:hypothetical protein [Bacteroidales bacterium]